MAEKGIPTQREIIHGDTVQNGIPTPENPIVPVSLTGFERKMTNADRIRQMTDEELAEMLDIYDVEEVCDYCAHHGDWACHNKCYAGILEWLKMEVEQDDKR